MKQPIINMSKSKQVTVWIVDMGLSEVNDHYKFRSLKNVIELKTKSSFLMN